jgi:hypothetical protein
VPAAGFVADSHRNTWRRQEASSGSRCAFRVASWVCNKTDKADDVWFAVAALDPSETDHPLSWTNAFLGSLTRWGVQGCSAS